MFKTSKANIKDIMEFRAKVSEKAGNGEIGTGSYNFFQKGIGAVLEEKMNDPLSTGRGSRMKMKTAYDAIKTNLKGRVPENEFTSTSTALFSELIKETEGKQVGDEEIRVLTKGIISNYFRSKYPSIALKEELPNKVASENSGISTITDEINKTKADVDIQGSMVLMEDGGGWQGYIPIERVKEAEERGLKRAGK
jgi:hypothetical protein